MGDREDVACMDNKRMDHRNKTYRVCDGKQNVTENYMTEWVMGTGHAG